MPKKCNLINILNNYFCKIDASCHKIQAQFLHKMYGTWPKTITYL